ncbi:CinA family protein [Rhodobacter sp. Har01]|uniref:CinA family protein n=1 Tax=Rhodobacter sp. Har01 TaxID=2883999 RepID=UPI001D06A294|nr:CinA family protein [Rhodobacter sp. Har01]MCB6177103.1 CinA family protein [Rhodobacter sp. Har01]
MARRDGHVSAEEVLDRARYWGLRIATAESCTGGMIAAALTDVAGSSTVFERGYVTYSNASKVQLLGVREETLAAHGAVSEQTAREMAEGALQRAGVALAVAVTGVAGPGSSDFKPEGRVCFAVARTGRMTRVETVHFGAIGRAKVRAASTEHALALLLAATE